jgi:probable blue pigment (indigoidine) exporter
LALPGTALPYVLWFSELRRASITAVTSWTLLVPVVGVVLGVLVLGESWSARQVAGTALVVAAMVLVVNSGRRRSERLACWQQSGCVLVRDRSDDRCAGGECT